MKLLDALAREYFIKQHDGYGRSKLRKMLKRSGFKRTEITAILDVYKNTPENERSLKYHLFKNNS